MTAVNVIALTQQLVSMDSVNPPGNEAALSEYIGNLLAGNGFEVDMIPYDENRSHLIAKKGNPVKKPVVFSGHLDTVPLGEMPWTVAPFSGKIKEDKIYGRGTSDMKGGVAAMVVAAIRATQQNPDASVCLIFTAGEETGCQGAAHLVKNYPDLGAARGIIIGEPTANIPAIGHKGGLYLKVTAKGKPAHSSMPHLGDNAIYKAAEAVLKLKKFIFHKNEDSLLGLPTLNIGKFRGGINLNAVPDHAEFTIDVRTTTKSNHAQLLNQFKQLAGRDLTFETLVDLPAVASDENDAFVQLVYSACGISKAEKGFPKAMPYLTDGTVLQSAYIGAPTIILGPGQLEMAHKTDEFCYIKKIEEAVEIYTQIILEGETLQ